MEKNEELAVAKKEEGLFQENEQKMFCSKQVATEDDKKALYNALEECDVLLNDCVGSEIEVKDVYCEQKQVVDEKTGELKVKFRTILFATNGQTYATGSYGIFNAIAKLIAIYGKPTWEKGIKVKVAKKPIGDGKQALTLTLI